MLGLRLAWHSPRSSWRSPCCIWCVVISHPSEHILCSFVMNMAINFKPSQAGLDKHLEGEHLEEAGLEHLPHLQEQLLDLRLRQQGDPPKLKTNEWRVTVRSRYPACHQEFCIMLYINFQPWTRLQCLSSILPAVCSVSGLLFRKLPSSISSEESWKQRLFDP